MVFNQSLIEPYKERRGPVELLQRFFFNLQTQPQLSYRFAPNRHQFFFGTISHDAEQAHREIIFMVWFQKTLQPAQCSTHIHAPSLRRNRDRPILSIPRHGRRFREFPRDATRRATRGPRCAATNGHGRLSLLGGSFGGGDPPGESARSLGPLCGALCDNGGARPAAAADLGPRAARGNGTGIRVARPPPCSSSPSQSGPRGPGPRAEPEVPAAGGTRTLRPENHGKHRP